MAKGKGGGGRPPVKGSNDRRPNGKAWKKFIRQWDPEKGRLVRIPNPNKQSVYSPLVRKADLRKKRFWEKVHVRGEDECWPWRAARHVQGYGAFAFNKDKIITAHRASWALTYNKSRLPSSKLHVMHQCDNKICVNPKHLKLGTPSENGKDAFLRLQKVPVRPILKKYCKRGHRRSHDNTIMKVGGKNKKAYPLCKQCTLDNDRASKERLKGPEQTRKNREYMREYRARKRLSLS